MRSTWFSPETGADSPATQPVSASRDAAATATADLSLFVFLMFLICAFFMDEFQTWTKVQFLVVQVQGANDLSDAGDSP